MRAYVIGNATIDERFAVDRLPAGGASILGRRLSSDLGGKGLNQAVVLARAGIETLLVAAVGDDRPAALIRQGLANEPLEARLVEIAGQASDSSLVLSDAEGRNAIVTTTDCAGRLSPEAIETRLADAAAGDSAVFQGNLGAATTRAALTACRARGLKTVLNPSPVDADFRDLLSLADTVFLNEGEAQELTGRADAAALQALQAQGVETVVLTRGAHGALLARGGEVLTVPAVPCDVADSTGAGDSFQSAALASALRRDTALDAKALHAAAQVAALTVSRLGTLESFPSRREIEALLNR